MFRPSRGHLQVDIWNIIGYTDHGRNENLASYGFLLQVGSLYIIDFEVKIED
jgi:hypothetical protein